MSDLQTTVGGSLNKLQDSLQQGKQKLQIAQEISQYRKVERENREKRAKMLLQLGEMTFKQLRDGEVIVDKLLEITNEIKGFDVSIYQAEKMIQSLSVEEKGGHFCSQCGNGVTGNDKFCGGCGQPVHIVQSTSAGQTEVCKGCEQEVPVETDYCVCCGLKK